MSARSTWWSALVAPLVLLAAQLVLGGVAGPPSEASPAMPPAQATVQPGAGRAGRSPTLLGAINTAGMFDIRDSPVWRHQFGATDGGTPADLDGNCLVDIRDYGIWRQNFGQTGPTLTPTPTVTATPTATPALQSRAYV